MTVQWLSSVQTYQRRTSLNNYYKQKMQSKLGTAIHGVWHWFNVLQKISAIKEDASKLQNILD